MRLSVMGLRGTKKMFISTVMTVHPLNRKCATVKSGILLGPEGIWLGALAQLFLNKRKRRSPVRWLELSTRFGLI